MITAPIKNMMIPNKAKLVAPSEAEIAAIPRTDKSIYLLMFVNLGKFMCVSFVI